jgi:hypothetical protein
VTNTGRPVPGSIPIDGRNFRYLQCPPGDDFAAVFPTLLTQPFPHHGGIINEAFGLTLPDGRRFCAVSYRGDLDGWENVLARWCANHTMALAQVIDDELIGDGSVRVRLSECVAEFD